MTIYYKSGSVWREVSLGNLSVRNSSGTWSFPAFFGGKSGTIWADSGYTSVIGKPTLLELVSSTMTSLEISWKFPTDGVIPTTYTISLFNQNGDQSIQETLPVSSVQFAGAAGYGVYRFSDDSFINPETNYFAVVTGNAEGAASTASDPLHIRTGTPAVTHEEWVGDWSTTEETMRPTFSQATSTLSPNTGDLSVDTLPGIEMWATAWKSGTRTSQIAPSPHIFWEGINYTVPKQNKLLVAVIVVCPPQHNVYVGVSSNEFFYMWFGNITPANIGMNVTGLPAGYSAILNHNYTTKDTTKSSSLKRMETGEIFFTEIDKISIAISNFTSDNGWRAWVQDVILVYRPWNPTSYKQTVVDVNEVPATAGMDAWMRPGLGAGVANPAAIRVSDTAATATAASASYTASTTIS